MPVVRVEVEGQQIVLHHLGGIGCATPEDLASSTAFAEVVTLYVKTLLGRNSPILHALPLDIGQSEGLTQLVTWLRALAVTPLEKAATIVPGLASCLQNRQALHEFVEGLYDFWRHYSPFMILHSEPGPNSHEHRPYRAFNATIERLTHLVRGLYGTEIGAFIRLDDLQQGYAFGQIDRAIIMSPQKVNARAVLPVTTMEEVLHGYPVDILLYANNYEEVDETHPLVEQFTGPEQALRVFREGAAMAKGTTTAKGLVHSYFANIFGAPRYQTLQNELAQRTFEAAFRAGVFVGQIRTRLGIPGYEAKGPEEVAKELFRLIAKAKQ